MSMWAIGPTGVMNSTYADALFSASSSDRQSQMQTLAQTALARGADRYTSGDYKGAARAFQSAVALDPSHDNTITSFNLLATAYLKDNNFDAAIKAYQSSISMAPDNDSAHLQLGNIYFSQNNYSAAEKEYAMAVRISPTSSANILALGQAYLAEGKYQDAEQQFRKVVSMDPAHEAGYYVLGQAYSKEGRSEDAIAQFQKALDLKKDFYEAAVDLGSAYADLKQFDKAGDQVAYLSANKPELAPLLADYIDSVKNPQILAAYSPDGFNTSRSAGTQVYSLASALGSPGGTRLFSMVFVFDKSMDPASVRNPYNWSISRSSPSSPGGAYNWGLPVPSTEAQISPVPLSVTYDADTNSATVSFLVRQNDAVTGTIDPSHIMFKFSGTDMYGNAMDTTADEFGGISKIV